MPFKRDWNTKCPKIWKRWEADGVKWTVEDLAPEDDNLAIDMLVDIFLNDEVLCSSTGANTDPASLRGAREFWNDAIKQRTSLGCYREQNGTKELVALNVCPVKCLDDKDEKEYEGEPWRQVLGSLTYCDTLYDAFKLLDVDKYLYGAGLLVRRDARGAKLGAKILDARKDLCKEIGIKATVTLFTGPASQAVAHKSGFQVFGQVSFAQMADAGYKIPKDDTRIMKVMYKKYQ